MKDLLRQSWALYQTLGLEHLWKGVSGKKKRDQAGVGSGRKSLTSVLIFHADLQSEKFSVRFLQ